MCLIKQHHAQTHGGVVCHDLDEALVILVDPPTPRGQRIIRELGACVNRAILDLGWVRRCVENGRWLGPRENWGGHRLPVTNVNEFFAIGPATHTQPSGRATLRDGPLSEASSLSFQELQRSFTQAALAVPPKPIMHQPGHPSRYRLPMQRVKGVETRHLAPLQSMASSSKPIVTFTADDKQHLISFFNWYLAKNPRASHAHVLRELANKAPHRTLRSWTCFFQQNESKWRPLIRQLQHTHQADRVVGEKEPSERTSNTISGQPTPRPHDTDAPRWDHPQPHSAPSELSASKFRMKQEDFDLEEGSHVDILRGHVLAPIQPSPLQQELHNQCYRQTDRLPSFQELKEHSPTSPSTSYTRTQARKPGATDFASGKTWGPFTWEEKLAIIHFLAETPWLWLHVIPKSTWVRSRTDVLTSWWHFEKMHPHRPFALWREFHKRNAEEFEAAALRMRTARDAGEPGICARAALAELQTKSRDAKSPKVADPEPSIWKENCTEETILTDDDDGKNMPSSTSQLPSGFSLPMIS
ncbi:hypothetical protein FRB98_001417 [Tulasnella sp. 332]|nr:hypothetical protein FRB98_001417 [Tulasnella sp. 332]